MQLRDARGLPPRGRAPLAGVHAAGSRAVLSALIVDEQQVPVLLDAIEQGSIDGAALGPSRRSRLMTHRDAAIQKRARALFAGVESGDRMQAYDRLRRRCGPGNAASGRQVFAAHCAPATRSMERRTGGPDLSGIRNQPADAILLHVLVPDYEISAGYQSYVVETRDGRTLVGTAGIGSAQQRDAARRRIAAARDPAE